jgi:uncharacterized protein
MTLEVRALGVACDLKCRYCYQNAHRAAGQTGGGYDLDAIKRAIEDHGDGFHLFGGEPLLMPERDLEELWRWGFERFGRNALQTNGARLHAGHVELIRRYQVAVGVSIDGPGELNDARWAGSLDRTRRATARSEAAIQMLCDAGAPPGLMLQLTRANCAPDRLPRLHDWLRRLDAMGVSAARLHVLEIDSPALRRELGMTVDENIAVLSGLFDLEAELTRLRFDLSQEMPEMLLGRDRSAACVWRACDPYTTEAVHGCDGHGAKHNCGLTDKEGINFQKPDAPGYERYLALYHTPQDHGGCQGCRFFVVCKGQCPGTAIDNDWRNRTEYCGVWKRLFARFEDRLVARGQTPITRSPELAEWERRLVDGWQRGHNLQLEIDLLPQLGAQPDADPGSRPWR